MKFLGLIVMLLFVLQVTGQDKKEFKEPGIPAFSVEYPKKEIKVERQEYKPEFLPGVTITSWVKKGKDKNGEYLYGIAHAVLPQEFQVLLDLDPNSLQTILQTFLSMNANQFAGSGFAFKVIPHDKYTIVELTGKVQNNTGDLKSRVYKIDKHLLFVGAGGQGADEKSIEKFIESFKVQ